MNLIVAIFIFQLVCWSMGLHYSRLFIASISLSILAAAIMADKAISPQDKLRWRIQKLLRFWIIFSLIISLVFQFWWLGKRYWGAFLFGAEKRYQAKIKFLKTKDYGEQNLLTFNETQMLNNYFLEHEVRPLVYVLTYSYRVLHILFDERIHIKFLDNETALAARGKYLLINPKYLEERKTWDKRILLRLFPVHILTTPETKWELYSVENKKLSNKNNKNIK